MTHTKIKVIATSSAQWAQVVNHARNLGAVSRDNAYEYNAEKPAMVIDNNYIKYSSPTMKSVAGATPPMKISVNEFLGLASLHDIGNIGKPVDKQAVATAVASALNQMPCAQSTLKVTSCEVLVQNAVVWSSIGLPMLKNLGVDVTSLDGVDYILDIKGNDAIVLTAESASKIAKEDLISGKITPYTTYAKACELITDLVMGKTLPDRE